MRLCCDTSRFVRLSQANDVASAVSGATGASGGALGFLRVHVGAWGIGVGCLRVSRVPGMSCDVMGRPGMSGCVWWRLIAFGGVC